MKEDGLENVDNLYTEDLNNYYYNRKTTHNVKYTATLNNPKNNTNDPEETVWYDAYKNLDENTNAQTLATSKYVSC